jgi:hypothetical protein
MTLSVFPVPIHPDGRKARISDGFHTAADKLAGMATRQHRGVDVMYRRPKEGKPELPLRSKWFEVAADTMAVAAGDGKVLLAGRIATGHRVVIDHGDGLWTGYYHLQGVLVTVGEVITAGARLGCIGCNPKGYGLSHLHFDVRLKGRYVDPAPYLKGTRHVP